MLHEAGVSLPEAVKMVSANPARIMGLTGRKGSLAPGYDADLVIFDEDINIRKTIIKGNIIYA